MPEHHVDAVDKLKRHIAICDPKDIDVLPPIGLSAINAVEGELGFALPSLLCDIYTKIGTGYFGFQCSLLELVHPMPAEDNFTDDPSVVQLYQHFRSNSIVPTNDDPLGEWPNQLILFALGDVISIPALTAQKMNFQCLVTILIYMSMTNCFFISLHFQPGWRVYLTGMTSGWK